MWWLLVAAVLLPACGDDDDDGASGGDVAPAPDVIAGSGASVAAPAAVARLNATLGGGQQVPPVRSSGKGTATFVLSGDRIDYTLNVAGLAGTTSHVHRGGLGVEGPILFDLSSQGTLRAEDLRAGTFGEALNAMREGSAYVSVRTLGHPDGEIRGQIGPVTLRSRLDGSQVVPPFDTPGSGTATFALSEDQTRLTFTLEVDGLLGPPLGAGLYVAPPGQNGPALFDLSTSTFDSPLRGALTADDLRPKPEVDVLSFADAVRALLSGITSVKVRTTARPAGEIRGQIGARTFPPLSPAPMPDDEGDDEDDDD